MSLVSYYRYIAISNLLVIVTVADAIMTFEQFYEVVVFLTSSRVFGIMTHNCVLANLLLAMSVVRKIFFGTLSAVEKQHMHDEMFMIMIETCISLVTFPSVINPSLSAAFAATVGFKLLHHLAVARLESIERSVHRPVGAIRRLTAFLTVSLFIDLYVVVNFIPHLYDSSVSIYLILLFKYSAMALKCLVTQVKLLMYLRDDGNAAASPMRFYLDAASTFIEGAIHLWSVATFTRLYAAPIHQLRETLISLVKMRSVVQNVIRYRRLVSNMDRNFSAATPEDLERDRRCAVCYDDMLDDTGCKKLQCGHCYHRDCLRKWLEANSACPYCRKDINVVALRRHAPNPPAARDAAAPQNVPDVDRQRLLHAAWLAALAPQVAQVVHQGGAARVDNDPVIPAWRAAQLDEEAQIQAAYAEYLRMHAMEDMAPHGAAQVAAAAPAVPATLEQLQARLAAFEEYKASVDAATLKLENTLSVLRAQAALAAMNNTTAQ